MNLTNKLKFCDAMMNSDGFVGFGGFINGKLKKK